jgi:hypothetical protein
VKKMKSTSADQELENQLRSKKLIASTGNKAVRDIAAPHQGFPLSNINTLSSPEKNKTYSLKTMDLPTRTCPLRRMMALSQEAKLPAL